MTTWAWTPPEGYDGPYVWQTDGLPLAGVVDVPELALPTMPCGVDYRVRVAGFRPVDPIPTIEVGVWSEWSEPYDAGPDCVPLPEPAHALVWGLVALAMLGRLRR